MNNHYFSKNLDQFIDPDALAIFEFKSLYYSISTNEKISLLKDIQEANEELPQEIIEIVLNDQDVRCRQWLAKNGKFFKTTPDIINLRNKFLNDADEGVRAGVCENHNFGWADWPDINFFNNCSEILKLAIMRRRYLPNELRESLFDYKDDQLKINISERANLIKVFLSKFRPTKEVKNKYHELDRPLVFSYAKEWEKISKWPDEYSWLKNIIYQKLDNSNDAKIVIFKISSNECKIAILEGSTVFETNCDELFKLAMEDPVNEVKYKAYSLAKWALIKNQFSKLLKQKDDQLFDALWENENVPRKEKLKIEPHIDYSEFDYIREELHKDYRFIENENRENGFEIVLIDDTAQKTLRFIGYAWGIVKELITITIILLVFDSAQDGFQRRVFAILIILFLTLSNFQITNGALLLQTISDLKSRLIHLFKVLKFSPTENEIEELVSLKKWARKMTVNFYTSSIFRSLYFLIALWNLV